MWYGTSPGQVVSLHASGPLVPFGIVPANGGLRVQSVHQFVYALIAAMGSPTQAQLTEIVGVSVQHFGQHFVLFHVVEVEFSYVLDQILHANP